MAGTNPYIEKAEFELPLQNYDVTFLPMQKKVAVLSEKITTESDGLPGSILNAALEAGIDMDIISKNMGHASVAITADIYAHLTSDVMEEAAKKIESRLFGE